MAKERYLFVEVSLVNFQNLTTRTSYHVSNSGENRGKPNDFIKVKNLTSTKPNNRLYM